MHIYGGFIHMSAYLKPMLKHALVTALALSLVLTFVSPLLAAGMSVDVTTAKSNETGTGSVLGGEPTRLTWEALVGDGEQVTAVHVVLPEGSTITDESSVKVTVLDGTTRLNPQNTAIMNKDDATVDVSFAEPLTSGLRLRLEMYKVSLPNVNGEVVLTGTYALANGQTLDFAPSPSIEVTHASAAEKLSNWLGEQPAVQAWNSVTFLRLFFQPELIVSSIPVVAVGWLISLGLVLVGFPLAIPIGLIAAFMKIARARILHILAAIYTGVVRGTPLFLQIYIAFFGLPLLGIDINQYVLAIIVLAVNSGAYLCEIFRAGIQSVPKGQFEASRSLGMTGPQTMFYVIIPQTIRRVIPTMTSEFILLYKDTSLLAAVGVMELMLYSRSIVSLTGNMTPYIVAACFYLIVTLPLIRVVGSLEKRLALADSGGAAPKIKARKNRRGAFSQMCEEIADSTDDARDELQEQTRLEAGLTGAPSSKDMEQAIDELQEEVTHDAQLDSTEERGGVR